MRRGRKRRVCEEEEEVEEVTAVAAEGEEEEEGEVSGGVQGCVRKTNDSLERFVVSESWFDGALPLPRLSDTRLILLHYLLFFVFVFSASPSSSIYFTCWC